MIFSIQFVEESFFSLNDLKNVELSKDRKRMKVETKDGEYAGVMGAAVNICSRIAHGCELSFDGFAYK